MPACLLEQRQRSRELPPLAGVYSTHRPRHSGVMSGPGYVLSFATRVEAVSQERILQPRGRLSAEYHVPPSRKGPLQELSVTTLSLPRPCSLVPSCGCVKRA
jgi:hypothetical protein